MAVSKHLFVCQFYTSHCTHGHFCHFAFEEVFYIQIQNAQNRAQANAASTYSFKTTAAHIKEFTKRFPFKLTESQDKSVKEVLKNFNGNHAMSRLLEGDVGSGKTAVAATTAYAVATSTPPEGADKEGESADKKAEGSEDNREEGQEEGAEEGDGEDKGDDDEGEENCAVH